MDWWGRMGTITDEPVPMRIFPESGPGEAIESAYIVNFDDTGHSEAIPESWRELIGGLAEP